MTKISRPNINWHHTQVFIRSLCGRGIYLGNRDNFMNETSPPEVIPLANDLGRPAKCMFNVLERVISSGGKQIYGWGIYLTASGSMLANYHSVWQHEDGKRWDVTPNLTGDAHTLFFEDKRVPFNFRDPRVPYNYIWDQNEDKIFWESRDVAEGPNRSERYAIGKPWQHEEEDKRIVLAAIDLGLI